MRRARLAPRAQQLQGPIDRLPLVLSVVRNTTQMRRSFLRRAGLSDADGHLPHAKFNGLTVDAHVALKEAWRRWQLARWPGPSLEIHLDHVHLPTIRRNEGKY